MISQEEFRELFIAGSNIRYITKDYFSIMNDDLQRLFGMKYSESSKMWYGEWEGHRRKVVSVRAVRGIHSRIFWGYNYDYFPQIGNNGAVKWHRTDKAVTNHIGASYFFFMKDFDPDVIDHEKLYNWELWYEFPQYTAIDDEEIVRSLLTEEWNNNIPFMTEWFEKTDTAEKTIAFVKNYIDHCHTLFGKRGSLWDIAYLLSAQGRIEEAEYYMAESYSDCKEYVKGDPKATLAGISGKRIEKMYAAQGIEIK